MNENLKDLFARLAEPFHPTDIEWRAGATNAEKTKALALAYITSRAVMDRLDEVLGPENWKDEYAPGPDGGVLCGLSLRIQNEWITKWDGADNTEFEAIKGGLSDAFKRAGYKWGVGRYLYKLESVWVPCEAHGKSVTLKSTPPLPSWALPDAWVDASGKPAAKKAQPEAPSFKEREKEILKELGFAEEPIPQAAHVPVSAPANGNGSNGNGKSQPASTSPTPPKRSQSWSSNFVSALIKAGLAPHPADAVRLLNNANLPQNVTPEQAVEQIKKQRSS